MGRNPKQPPEGGAVQSEPVREQIKQMTGFASADELAEALPDNTMQPQGDEGDAAPRPRKPRRSKEEIARSRGVISLDLDPDPLMQDKRYAKAVEKMRTAGLSNTVKSGFDTVAVVTEDEAWELEAEEIEDVDDFSYVMSKKFPVLDPTRHWLGMAVYFLALLGTLTFKRLAKQKGNNMMKWLTDLFKPEEEELDAQQLEEQKQGSV
jgi:hypothetical protein